MVQITFTLSANTLHCALELSKNSWLLAIQFRDREQPSLWRLRQAAPSEESDHEIRRFQLGSVERDAELCDQHCQLFIVEMVGVVHLRIFVRGRTQNRAKGPDLGNMKERLRDGTPKIAIKCFQDKVIGTQRRTHHGLAN